jgi:hypothetical protein
VTTTSAANIPAPAETVELPPSYAIPATLLLCALLIAWVQPWVSIGIGLFGLFLLLQAATIRLRFTATALDVCRGETCLRHFPYQDWQNWQIFWGGFPILLYFREVKSIHFLPILFNPKQLRICLEQRCSRIQPD